MGPEKKPNNLTTLCADHNTDDQARRLIEGIESDVTRIFSGMGQDDEKRNALVEEHAARRIRAPQGFRSRISRRDAS